MYVSVFPVCMYFMTSQKRVLDLVKLELRVVVHRVDAGN